VGGEDGLEAGEGSVVVEEVEALEAVAHDRIEVERIGVICGGRGVGAESWRGCGEEQYGDDEEDAI
jgi:hypothetical protein